MTASKKDAREVYKAACRLSVDVRLTNVFGSVEKLPPRRQLVSSSVSL
jgi:hypothetical protein